MTDLADLTLDDPVPVGVTPYVYLREEQASGTIPAGGGTLAGTTWQKRTLNTETDADGICTLTSSVIVLAAGTYVCHALAPSASAGSSKLRLYNTSDSAVVLAGVAGFANTGTFTAIVVELMGQFTIGASKNLELQHWASSGKSGDGLGNAVTATGTVEVYAAIEFWKVG